MRQHSLWAGCLHPARHFCAAPQVRRTICGNSLAANLLNKKGFQRMRQHSFGGMRASRAALLRRAASAANDLRQFTCRKSIE